MSYVSGRGRCVCDVCEGVGVCCVYINIRTRVIVIITSVGTSFWKHFVETICHGYVFESTCWGGKSVCVCRASVHFMM